MNLTITSKLPFESPVSEEASLEFEGIVHLRDLTPGLGVLHLHGSEAGSVISRFLEGQADQDPLATGEARPVQGGILCRFASDEYLILVDTLEDLGTYQTHLAGLVSGDRAALSDLSHGYGKLELGGPGSIVLLPRLCGLDFSDTSFPNGHVAQTSLAKVHATLVRLDGKDPAPKFIILVDRSLSAYIWEVMKAVIQDLTLEESS